MRTEVVPREEVLKATQLALLSLLFEEDRKWFHVPVP